MYHVMGGVGVPLETLDGVARPDKMDITDVYIQMYKTSMLVLVVIPFMLKCKRGGQ